MKITVLGCGSSNGVPEIACKCNVCTSNAPYNKRTCSAIVIEDKDTKILVDFGYDIKHQLVNNGIMNLDAAILTHDHADHVSGLDHLKIFNFLYKKPLKIYMDNYSMVNLSKRYNYLVEAKQIEFEQIDFYDKVTIKNLQLQFFKQHHGKKINSIGIRVNNFVYSSDVKDFPQKTWPFLQNINLWILDCIGFESTSSHCGLDKVIKWYKEFLPKKLYLTNMTHHIDYFEIQKHLPVNVKPCYDGMVLSI